MQLRHSGIIDRNVGCPLGAVHREGDDRPPIAFVQRCNLAKTVLHRGDVGQLYNAPSAQRYLRVRQRKGIRCIGQHPHRLPRSADLCLTARRIEVERAQHAVHLRRGNTKGLHPGRVQRHQNLSADTAAALHSRQAFDRQQAARHHIVDKPRQLLRRHVIGGNLEIGDRVRRGIDLEHPRLDNTIGQFAADLVNGVLHLVDHRVDIYAHLELHYRLAVAFRCR